MTNLKHTPAPWFADVNGNIWRRNPSELYQNGGGVAGDKPIASVHIGWAGEDLTGYPVKANARLIAAAPELLEALKDLYGQVMQAKKGFGIYDSSPSMDKAIHKTESAIAKATGEQS